MVTGRENSDELTVERNRESPDEKMEFQEMGINFLGEKSHDKIRMIGDFDDEAKRVCNFGSQELTLSYLCENSKLGFPEKDVSGQNLFNSFDKLSGRYNKGKEILVSEDQTEEAGNNMWVERDFLQLNENRGNSSKREAENVENIQNEGDNREKKPKVESLNLSLALPDVSLSLAGSNRVQNMDLPSRLRPSRSVQSLGPSYNNNTQTTYSNDFTAASLSYSYSHLSHNPSCSLTRNSTENYEYSAGSHRRDCDQIWNCGEGTNGSVHSRFRPIGDGTVALSNHMGGNNNRSGFNKDSCNNSLYRTTSSDNISFFPSELPARPKTDTQSGDSRRRNNNNNNNIMERDSEDVDVVKVRKLSKPERILREIVSESIPVMAQIIQEITDETIESCKEYLKNIILSPERKDEFLGLQKRLERRSDITNETLSKCQKSQLEILVAIKMGLASFVSKNRLPSPELVDIFLLERCRNINCRRLLPVDDCECKICSTKKGFCAECMCPVCLNFDCANNTCSWVGCDACAHWCHAACGLERNLIKPGTCSKGFSEMQFHCLGCGHASEMFGFVKEVFMSCAKDWGLETLIKELDCVRKIFGGSEDRKGKGLHLKAEEMMMKLHKKIVTPSEVCSSIFQFFNSSDGFLEMGSSSMPSKELTHQPSFGKDISAVPLSNSLTPKPSSFYNTNTSNRQNDSTPFDLHHNENIKNPIMNEKIIEDEWSVKPVKKDGLNSLESLVRIKEAKKDGFDSLESLVRIKEAEARMFQSRADEARREIEGFRRMVRMKTEKLEEEYAEKLGKLCLQETEERRRKKLEELKMLENSHCDYYKMKLRMQSEISGLLKRMEATKQQLV